MCTTRKGITPNQSIYLVNQVDGVCPLCSDPLIYEKSNARHKAYDVAHIYPLNPRDDEERLLASEDRLHADVNHVDNLIPLCKGCHTRFDKPRTVAEYRHLKAIKEQLIRQDQERDLWHRYELEAELKEVVEALVNHDGEADVADLDYDPKTVDEKTGPEFPAIAKRKIHRDVQDYFSYVRSLFSSLETDSPGTADLIAQQVKAFHLAHKRRTKATEHELYLGVAKWIHRRVGRCSREAAEVLASFFVQNCEVL